MTRLRKLMLEELERRNYTQTTRRAYLLGVEQFAKHFQRSPDTTGSLSGRFGYGVSAMVHRRFRTATNRNRSAASRTATVLGFSLRTRNR